ncbi:MAG TPA: type II toxin-antitoxin system RelE/ParE family toxin [Pararhizobium sp.]|uniref:type II toxin-antitoxin system RelE/ParE family toxin n=1 Tax=Pararhizobium sp. TaxID=1977563 RepID=UPI002BFE3EB3|nr:type II toxin-antitoxin system RelE/ParE family toxin [Pararhizobium sp.]HTO30325.1 type II toxin-antitoxin system RelE/ParE family toxin [Pararhizobium sp.]
MAKYILSPRAEEDLRDIWRAIASELRMLCCGGYWTRPDLAARRPDTGSPRPELSPTARILIEGRYIMIYEPVPYGIFVVAIVYGARDVESWLD